MLTELVPPHREQPTDNAMAPSDLRDIGPFLEALRHDPGLLLSRPLPSPTLPRDHLDAAIGAALLPGIKHGFMHGICHSPPPKSSSCQDLSQLSRAMPRWGAHAGYTFSDPVSMSQGCQQRTLADCSSTLCPRQVP